MDKNLPQETVYELVASNEPTTTEELEIQYENWDERDWEIFFEWDWYDSDRIVKNDNWDWIDIEDDNYVCLYNWVYTHIDDAQYCDSRWEYYYTDNTVYLECRGTSEHVDDCRSCSHCGNRFLEDSDISIEPGDSRDIYCESCAERNLYWSNNDSCYYVDRPSEDPEIDDYQWLCEYSSKSLDYIPSFQHDLWSTIADHIKSFYYTVIGDWGTIPYSTMYYHKETLVKHEWILSISNSGIEDIIRDQVLRRSNTPRINKKYVYDIINSCRMVEQKIEWNWSRRLINGKRLSQFLSDTWSTWTPPSCERKIKVVFGNDPYVKQLFLDNNKYTSSCQRRDNVESYAAWFATSMTNWWLHFALLFDENDMFRWRMVFREMYCKKLDERFMIPDRLYHRWWSLWNDLPLIYKKVITFVRWLWYKCLAQRGSQHDKPISDYLDRLNIWEEMDLYLTTGEYPLVHAIDNYYSYYHDSETLSYYTESWRWYDSLDSTTFLIIN